MSTLDTQIGELTAKVKTLTTAYANMGTTVTSEQKLAAKAELTDLQAMLDNLLKIRKEQASNNDTILKTYTTATQALKKVNDLATQSDSLTSTLKTDSETKKNSIHINTYYGKQYEEYKNLFIRVTIFCICMIAALSVAYTPLEALSRPLSIAVGIVGGAMIAYKIIEIVLRSNMNYDEYQWIAAPVTDDGIENANKLSDKIVDVSGISLGTICVGPLCCGEGTEWNSKKGCVLIPQAIQPTSSKDTPDAKDTTNDFPVADY